MQNFIEELRSEGYAVIRGFLTPAETEEIAAEVECRGPAAKLSYHTARECTGRCANPRGNVSHKDSSSKPKNRRYLPDTKPDVGRSRIASW